MKKDGVLGKMMSNKVSIDLYMFGVVREDVIVNNPRTLAWSTIWRSWSM